MTSSPTSVRRNSKKDVTVYVQDQISERHPQQRQQQSQQQQLQQQQQHHQQQQQQPQQ